MSNVPDIPPLTHYRGDPILLKVFWQNNLEILEHSAILGTFGNMGTKMNFFVQN
jgi:hypothetical protein